MVVKEIENYDQVHEELIKNGEKLIVADLTGTFDGMSARLSFHFDELSDKYEHIVFLKVDIERYTGRGPLRTVFSLPVFLMYRNKIRLAEIHTVEIEAVESKLIELFETPLAVAIGDCGVNGLMDLNPFIVRTQCEALNDSDDHPLSALIENQGYIESDCDEQLILSFSFKQSVKVHSIRITAPKDNGPKSLKLFINQPNTIDFDTATCNLATQELELKPDELDGKIVNLKFMKFLGVYNLQIFVVNNQTDEKVTRIDSLDIIGMPISTTHMGDSKCDCGKPEEAH